MAREETYDETYETEKSLSCGCFFAEKSQFLVNKYCIFDLND